MISKTIELRFVVFNSIACKSISVCSALSDSAADSNRVKVKILNTASESSIGGDDVCCELDVIR